MMERGMLETELQRLQRLLEERSSERQKEKNEQYDLEEGIAIVQNKLRETEERMQGILSSLKAKVALLSEGNKFGEVYYSKVEKLMKGDKCAKVLDPLSEAVNVAKRRFLDLDNMIEDNNREVKNLENEINSLRQQMNALEEERYEPFGNQY